MDKRVIFAVAGAGKTTLLVNKLSLDKRALVLTYTMANQENLKRKIIEKFGFFPKNITLMGYFPFLYRFCFKPFLSHKLKARGLYWDIPPKETNRISRDKIPYYLTSNNRLYHNRLAKLLEKASVLPKINMRLEKYFDQLFIDEIQDFAGHDFKLLESISQANIEMLLVGDFFQHTFDTSRDGNVNSSLHDNYESYIARFEQMGLSVDLETLRRSYRCSPTTCNFICNQLGIQISSHRNTETRIESILDEDSAEEIFHDNTVTKLFFRVHYRYPCRSQNWGKSKGEDHHEDVCIVISPPMRKKLESGVLPPRTVNKLYVALSRARGNIYIASSDLFKKFKQE